MDFGFWPPDAMMIMASLCKPSYRLRFHCNPQKLRKRRQAKEAAKAPTGEGCTVVLVTGRAVAKKRASLTCLNVEGKLSKKRVYKMEDMMLSIVYCISWNTKM